MTNMIYLKESNTYIVKDNQQVATFTAQKTIFSRPCNIMKSSKRPSKYHLSINFLSSKKTAFPTSKKFKTRTFQ